MLNIGFMGQSNSRNFAPHALQVDANPHALEGKKCQSLRGALARTCITKRSDLRKLPLATDTRSEEVSTDKSASYTRSSHFGIISQVQVML
ncbi:hypothetical protein FRX31_025782 [Thalictrum thalictroides]|uniref:Uncharacterized protein n=1 Tax=Thalictrum thalictroides TaxID=46969 RepID=A0A7J6VJZ3_THATH|nr:hypothetical protein FRX31_025782 [Thalictrum thalictroides]